MSAAKAKPAEAEKPAVRGQRGRVVVMLVAVIAFAGAGYGVSQFAATHVVTAAHYKFDGRDIHTTPLPSWIHTDLKTEALHAGSLSGPLSVLDPTLAERISKAFRLHPWVKQVGRVRLTNPAGAEVDLVFRQPACMVEVPGGLYPVDEEGVLLPTADFTANGRGPVPPPLRHSDSDRRSRWHAVARPARLAPPGSAPRSVKRGKN